MGNHRSRILILTFILYGFTGFAQEHFNLAEKAIKQGRELYSIKFYDSAAIYFQKGIELADQEKDEWNKTTAQSALVRTWLSLKEFDKVIEISNSILNNDKASTRAKVISHQNIGLVNARSLKNFEKEFYHNHKALRLATEAIPTHFNNERSNDSLHISNKSRALQVLAYMHRNRKGYDSAYYYFNKLIELATNTEPINPYDLAKHRSDLIVLYFIQSKLEEAKKEFDKTQPLIDQLALKTQEELNLVTTYYNSLGYYYSKINQADSSLMAKRKQEEIMSNSIRIDSVLLARLQSNIGISYYSLGDLVSAAEYEKKAFTLKKRILQPDHPSFAISYKMLGVYLIGQSHSVNEALEYFKENLRINEKIYGKEDPRTVDAMHTLSHGLNEMGRFNEALKLSRETLSIQRKIRGDDYTTAAIYTSIADNLSALDSLKSAIAVYKELITFSNNSETDLQIMQINAESGLGLIYVELEQFAKAEQHLRNSEELLIKVYGVNDYRLSAVYNGITTSLQKQGRLTEALEINKKAIRVNSYDTTLFKVSPIPLNLLAKTQIQFVDSYINRIKLLVLKEAEEGNNRLEEFWAYFDTSVEIIEDWMSEQNNDSDIISIQSLNKDLYSAGIDALWLIHGTTNESLESLRMWQFSERSKAVNQKLIEKKRQAINPLEANAQILTEQRIINDEITRYKSLALDGNEHDSVGAGLFDALQAKKDLELRIKLESPQNYQLNYLGEDVSYDDVKNFLGDKQTIIDYFVSGESLYAFVINNNSIHDFKFDWTEELQQQISDFKNGLIKNSDGFYQLASSNIYQKIFKPLESAIVGSNVIIVPDRSLWNINFDLLKTNARDSLSLENNYLIEKYAISYSYSTSLLLNTKKKRNTKRQVLAFAYAEDDLAEPQLENMRDAAKENLPGTANEIRALATTFNGSFYYGNQANEQRFKQIASDYSILHLALHGEVNDEDPDNSKLFFKGKGQNAEDNTLYTFELYNMNLNADLAVLSACNTGTGKISDGEGIMSLGKAFQYAGVNSVLLSQWEVSDAVAPVIIESFYGYLKEGQNKAEALRSAKLDFLNTSNNITSNPYYWGSFFILGNTESISFKTNDQKWFWLLGIPLVIILVISRKRKVRNLAA